MLTISGGKKISIAHTVLETFIGPRPHGLECDHINRIPHDNRLENLRWVTRSENMRNRVISPEGKVALGKTYIWTDEQRAAARERLKNRARKKNGQLI